MATTSASSHSTGPRGHVASRHVGLLSGRDLDRALAALTWTSDGDECTGSVQILSGTAVISLEGHLGRRALKVCRSALDAAIRVRPAHVIVDLGGACTDVDSAGLLALMVRAASRHGLVLQFAEVPPAIQLELISLAPAGSYQVHASLPVALRVVTGAVRPVIP